MSVNRNVRKVWLLINCSHGCRRGGSYRRLARKSSTPTCGTRATPRATPWRTATPPAQVGHTERGRTTRLRNHIAANEQHCLLHPLVPRAPTPTTPVYLQAVQATMILATILCCVSFFVFILQLFKLQQGERFVFTAVIQLLACECAHRQTDRRRSTLLSLTAA